MKPINSNTEVVKETKFFNINFWMSLIGFNLVYVAILLMYKPSLFDNIFIKNYNPNQAVNLFFIVPLCINFYIIVIKIINVFKPKWTKWLVFVSIIIFLVVIVLGYIALGIVSFSGMNGR